MEATCMDVKATNSAFHVSWSPTVEETGIVLQKGISIQGQTGRAFDLLAGIYNLDCIHTPTGPFFVTQWRRHCTIPVICTGEIEIMETTNTTTGIHMSVLFHDQEMFFPEVTVMDSTGRFVSVIQMQDIIVGNEIGLLPDKQTHASLAGVKGIILHANGFSPATNSLSLLPLRTLYRINFRLTPTSGSETTDWNGPPGLEEPVSGFGHTISLWCETDSTSAQDDQASDDPFQ